MEIFDYTTLKERLYHEKMPNGLEVYLLKKEGFSKTYGLFATKFGSIDTRFVPLGQTEMVKVPDGVAHFLEHKMFEMPDGDASDAFSRLGAATNAFTSSSRTAYLFSTGERELECTELLLDFVQDIYLTEKNVEKEKGIICQEIKMYDDDPDWQNYFGAIRNLYVSHPVAVDIAGTCESVNATQITDLETCYRTFYHPSNMVLFVVGHIEPEQMMEMIRKNQAAKIFADPVPIKREKVNEPDEIASAKTVTEMDVVMPKLTLAIKINDLPETPYARIRRELSMNIIMDLLFSKSSSLYHEWLGKGLINDTFGGFFTQERDYSYIQIGGDTAKPDVLEQALKELVKQLPDYPFAEADFERIRKKTMGNFIMMFNSPENIANLFIRYHFEGFSAFELIDVLNDLTFQDLNDAKQCFKIDLATIHLVNPRQ